MDKGLDEAFKSTVAEMKPFAKNLPQKSSERHRVTQWMKKLLGVKYEKKQRNAHAKLLLQQLKSGKLALPFTDDPPIGLLQTPPSRSPDQPNELDSLFTSALSSSTDASHTSKRSTGTSNHISGASKVHSSDSASSALPNHSEQRKRTLNSHRHLSFGDLSNRDQYSSFEPRFTSTVAGKSASLDSRLHDNIEGGNSSLNLRKQPSRVHYADSAFLPGDKTRTSPSKVSSHGRFQTNLPNGFGSSSSNGYRSTHHHHHHVTSPSHRQQSRHGGRGEGCGFMKEQEVDVDLMVLDDLDTSPLSLSDELVGGADCDELLDDGELSDVSELLMMSPRHHTKTTSSRIGRSRPANFSSLSPYHSKVNPSVPLSLTPSHSPLKADISREILQAREVELRLQTAETRFEEEKLVIQKTQEESIKKLLDRKNNELEDLRSEHHLKVAQLEAQNQRLERKLSQLERDHTHLQEIREMEVVDSRNSSQHLRQQLQADFDKKLNSAIAGFERDKLELEQYRSKQLQRIIKESSARMAKMEEEQNTQNKNNKDVVSGLEARIEEMTREMESLSQANSRLTQEKITLEQTSSSLQNQLTQAQERVSALEEELSSTREEREHQLKQLRSKMEQNAKSLQHQHSIQEAKIMEQVTELHHHLSSSREEIESVKASHQQQLIELEASHQQLWREKDLEHDKKLIALRTELKQIECSAEERKLRLEASLRETKEQLSKTKASQELRARQAENTIEDFKAQVEQQTSVMFEEMQSQLSHLDAELKHTKAKSERQAREFAREKKEERHQSEMERESLKQQHEEQVMQIVREHRTEMERLRRELEEKRELSVAKLTSALGEAGAQAKAKAAHSSKVISSLEGEVMELRDQLEEEQREHELEVSEVREKAAEERTSYYRIHESAISKLKSQLEKQKSHLREERKVEISNLIEKHEHKVEQMEQDFSLRTAQHNETVSGLQTQLDLLQEDLESQQRSHEQQLSDLVSRTEEERASMKHHHQTVVKDLQQDIDSAHATINQLEERERRHQADHDSKVSRMRLQHENSLKGMMPSSVKQEYEETIKSLRTQVSILTQRASLLQDEVDRSYTTPSPTTRHSSHSHTLTIHSPQKHTTLSVSRR